MSRDSLLDPIFNPVTHMVALPFPLLLIVPGIAIDLLLRRAGEITGTLRLLGLSMALGAAFFAVFGVVQWYFAEFLLSPQARNWFFMSDRIWSYNTRPGDWQLEFWGDDPRSGPPGALSFAAIGVIWAVSTASSAVGLFFGRWMRKVRR